MFKLGKRGAVKYPADISLLDIYPYYVDKFKVKRNSKFLDDLDSLALSKNDCLTIAKDILDYKMTRILENAECAKLFYSLGEIRVQKKKMRFSRTKVNPHYLKTDWGHFQKTGEIKKHLNEHTNNYRYRILWLCKKGVVGKGLYKFIPIRDKNRKLKNILSNTNKDYFE